MYLNKWAKILFATLAVVFSSAVHSQLKITGKVTDIETKNPLTSVSVSDSDNKVTTKTDENGIIQYLYRKEPKRFLFLKKGIENLQKI